VPIEQQIEEAEYNEAGVYLNNTQASINESWLNYTTPVNDNVPLTIFARNLSMKLKSQTFDE
jgi:hypothetical protein